MQKLDKSTEIILSKIMCVILTRWRDDNGKQQYAYVGLYADKLQEFAEFKKRPDFAPEKLGPILASGEGEPDTATKAFMENEYGFRHNEQD